MAVLLLQSDVSAHAARLVEQAAAEGLELSVQEAHASAEEWEVRGLIQIEAAARNLETTAKIDQFSSILFGAVAPEGEPREALAALVTYARDREAEAERHTKLLEEQRAQILDMEDQLDQASPNHKPPNSPPGVEYVTELEDMVELLEAENQKLLDKAQSRRKALQEAQAVKRRELEDHVAEAARAAKAQSPPQALKHVGLAVGDVIVCDVTIGFVRSVKWPATVVSLSLIHI